MIINKNPKHPKEIFRAHESIMGPLEEKKTMGARRDGWSHPAGSFSSQLKVGDFGDFSTIKIVKPSLSFLGIRRLFEASAMDVFCELWCHESYSRICCHVDGGISKFDVKMEVQGVTWSLSHMVVFRPSFHGRRLPSPQRGHPRVQHSNCCFAIQLACSL